MIVADLGGGTLDFSAYKVESRDPVKFHESAVAKCMDVFYFNLLQFSTLRFSGAIEGSEVITRRAESLLLRTSPRMIISCV